MIVLLSPAKSLDLECENPWGLDTTSPVFAADAEALVKELAKMSQAELKSLLSVSDALAKLNHQRYQAWHSPNTPQKPCVLAFNGPAYQHLRAAEFTREQAALCQNSVRILSGLFGLLKPLDLIKPYRLDMGRKLRNSRGNNLYAHWSDVVSEQLNRELDGPEHEGSRFFVNCASQEYFKVVDLKKLRHPVFNVMFPGLTAIYAKQGRGAMVRHIICSGARSIKDLQAFTGNQGEFRFDSTAAGPPEKLAFKRVAGAGGKGKQEDAEAAGPDGSDAEEAPAGGAGKKRQLAGKAGKPKMPAAAAASQGGAEEADAQVSRQTRRTRQKK